MIFNEDIIRQSSYGGKLQQCHFRLPRILLTGMKIILQRNPLLQCGTQTHNRRRFYHRGRINPVFKPAVEFQDHVRDRRIAALPYTSPGQNLLRLLKQKSLNLVIIIYLVALNQRVNVKGNNMYDKEQTGCSLFFISSLKLRIILTDNNMI